MEPARQIHRETRGLPALDGLLQDFRYATRALRRSPAFIVTAIAMLALGIGVNVAVFTLTNALYKPPPFDHDGRIVYLHSGSPTGYVSLQDFRDWQAQASSFTGLALVNGLRVSVSDSAGLPESYNATEVSANAFQVLNKKPALGRGFTLADEAGGGPPAALISFDLWQKRYAGDPGILGRGIRINGVSTAIAGVMPQGFFFPRRQDIWLPLRSNAELEKREARDIWFAFGRLRPGVSLAAARAELGAIGTRLAGAYPQTNRAFAPVVEDFRGNFVGQRVTLIFQSMLGAVGFVLLIACANLANLMLARSVGRSREISMRLALGAGRWRIIRQLLMESLTLASAGGFAGWLLARWAVRVYQRLAFSGGPPGWIDYSMDWRVFAWLVAISLGTGLLFGLAPAARFWKLDITRMLKDSGRGLTSVPESRLSAVLVATEMAIAIMLLSGAGVMTRSFLNIYTADVGVKADRILTAYLPLPDSRYSDVEKQIAFYDQLGARLRALPGVQASSIAISLPTTSALRRPWQLAGAPLPADGRLPSVSVVVISPGYFDTLGAAVVAGRDFNDSDEVASTHVAIVNERFASRWWPGQNAVGRQLRLFRAGAPERWLTVAGVASNIIQNDRTRQQTDPVIYIPYRQKPGGYMWMLARTAAPPASLENDFRRQVQALDPDLPIFSLQPLADRLGDNYRDRGSMAALFLIFATIALLLASAGLHAVIVHSVNRRTHEIGVRIAVGALTRDILRLVLRQALIPLAWGLAIGLIVSFGVNRILKTELVQVSPADPAVMVVAASVLIVATTLGCLLPAIGASRIDPAAALRHE